MNAVRTEPPTASWDGIGVSVAQVIDRLAEQRRPPDGGPPMTLAGVLNLLVHVPCADDLAPMQSVIEHLADHQPSRAVLLVVSDEGEGIDATVATSCRLSGGNVSVGVEVVVLWLHGARRAGDASAIVGLLRSDLPTLLWWPDAPDLSPAQSLARLAPLADRIVTESGRHRDAAEAIRRLAAWVPHAPGAVTDMAWAAITPWRQLIVQVAGADAFSSVKPVHAVIAHSGSRPSAESLLLAGWLGDMACEVTMRALSGSTGTLRGIELTVPADGRRIAIEHMPECEAATVRVRRPDSTLQRRTLALPHLDRARLLAGELNLQRRDHAFERALPYAAEVASR